ncbi:lactonase family protein [Zavarzinella formosa]|uniref:lactonase family protein n=1 Tax=Zavarzinella formosa TaxID=360055 RepID=UPI00030813B7|nr:lactonase family protein [Zavarzinella formosa]
MRMTLAALMVLWIAGLGRAKDFVYVALADEKKIAVYARDIKDGKLTFVADAKCDGEPAALITDPAKKFLFASIRAEGKLSSFRIDQATGKLTPLSTVDAGADPAHISTDKEGKFLFCAYYVAARVTVNAIDKDGMLSKEPLQSIPTADKAHSIHLDPSNKFALVGHTGSNSIFQFNFDPATGKLTPNKMPKLSTPPMSGPRHFVFHPNGTTVYFDNEQDASVTVYKLEKSTGTLAPLQTITTLPKDYKGMKSTAEIRIHPSGKFLYVANRVHDSIASFKIGEDTLLTPVGQTPTENNPRSFDIDPDGKFLYAAGESSGKLATFKIDEKTGDLTRIATQKVGTMPWWVMTVRYPD